MEKFLEQILNQCLTILESDSGSVLIMDRDRREIVVRVARGKTAHSILGTRVKLGDGISGMVAEQQTPLLVRDVRDATALQSRCQVARYRTHSFVSVPLLHEGRLWGVMNITEKAGGEPFSLKELALVCAVAGCAGATLATMARQEQLEQELQSLKDGSALRKLSGVIAHELNNPLDGALRYAQLCFLHLPDHDSSREYILEIQGGLKRMADIIRQMHEFSLSGDRTRFPLPRPRVKVGEVAEKVLRSYRHYLLASRIEMQYEMSEAGVEIADYGLETALSHLVRNALEAMGSGGKLTMRARREDARLRIDVIDSGPGVEPGMEERIFEPFYSTKSRHAGLGLAIVREIASQYQGRIGLERGSQGGVQFTLEIPTGGSHENAYSDHR